MGGGVDNIPDGWNLCDGTNGTPDLRDKFILGAGSTYSIGDIGGESEVTLTTTQIPDHFHAVEYGNDTLYITAGNIGSSMGNTTYRTVLMANSTRSSDNDLTYPYEGGNAHNNIPPYYALAYIMKI